MTDDLDQPPAVCTAEHPFGARYYRQKRFAANAKAPGKPLEFNTPAVYCPWCDFAVLRIDADDETT